jgi:hypothetical protein
MKFAENRHVLISEGQAPYPVVLCQPLEFPVTIASHADARFPL